MSLRLSPGMTTRLRSVGAAIVLLAAALLLTQGCRSTPKIDWNSRIGSYTYDQAVVDFGPPDKTATLSDGRTVAEWVTRRSGGGAFSIGTGVYGGHTGVSVGQTVGTGGGDRVLRLTFEPSGVLASVAGK